MGSECHPPAAASMALGPPPCAVPGSSTTLVPVSLGSMTDTEPPPARPWLYRFSRPGGIELETRELAGNDAAEAHARELSKAQATPVTIQCHDHVDWEYVTEVDERPCAAERPRDA